MTTPSDVPRPPWNHDVVVIGAGVAGLAAAHELASAGVDVAVLEAKPTLGQGASGLGVGHAFHGLVEHPWRLEESLGLNATQQLLRLGARALSEIEAWSSAPSGGLTWCAAETEREPRELVRSQDTLHRCGIEASLLDPIELSETTGTRHLGPGLHLPRERAIDANALLETLARRLGGAGGHLQLHCPAESVTEDDDGVAIHLHDGSVIRAEVVILAAGAHTQRLTPEARDILHPVREVAVTFEVPEGRAWALRVGYGWTALTRHHAGTLVASGCRWASPHLEEGEWATDRWHPAVEERIRASARRFVPDLGAPLRTHAWLEAVGCDGVPVVGPSPSSRRRLLCAGFSANPISLGLACGQQIARGLLDGLAPHLPAAFDPSRFV